MPMKPQLSIGGLHLWRVSIVFGIMMAPADLWITGVDSSIDRGLAKAKRFLRENRNNYGKLSRIVGMKYCGTLDA